MDQYLAQLFENYKKRVQEFKNAHKERIKQILAGIRNRKMDEIKKKIQ